MKTAFSDQDFYPDYPRTFSLLRKLACDSYSSLDDGKALGLNYDNPKGLLVLTLGELKQMNRPDFVTPYQIDPTTITKEDVLLAIKVEFEKEIMYVKKGK